MLIKHLENNTKIMAKVDIGHPWASNPSTIGSIASMYMSILFMREVLPENYGYNMEEQKLLKNIQAIQENNVF